MTLIERAIGEMFDFSDMRRLVIENRAKGPEPWRRVLAPRRGERCPRCHARGGRGRSVPCMLCNPGDVPRAFGGWL